VKKKLDKLKRIEKLQKRLHDLSVWRLAHLAQQREQLATTHSEMIQSLGDGLLQFGGAASAATRRIRSIELEMASARNAFEAQSKTSQSHGARSRLAERAVETAAGQYRQELEKKSLSELIEWSLQADNSGSRKP